MATIKTTICHHVFAKNPSKNITSTTAKKYLSFTQRSRRTLLEKDYPDESSGTGATS
jgi:hypothetical protein